MCPNRPNPTLGARRAPGPTKGWASVGQGSLDTLFKNQQILSSWGAGRRCLYYPFCGLALGQTTIAGGWASPTGAAAVLPTMCLGEGNTSGGVTYRPALLVAGARGKGALIFRFWVGARPDHSSWRLGQPHWGRGSPSNYVSGEACH
jgi:hypothetical protein